MIDATCALLFAIPMLLLLAALIFLPVFISKQNQKMFEYLKENQDIVRLQLEANRKAEREKSLVSASLQAYERMILFLERINLTNMITRVMTPGLKAGNLQALLLGNLREEYEHNMSQQLYISNHTWELIKSAKEDIVKRVNLAASNVKQDADASELAKELLTSGFDSKTDPVGKAISGLKKDMGDTF
jgi:hypothetical protein